MVYGQKHYNEMINGFRMFYMKIKQFLLCGRYSKSQISIKTHKYMLGYKKQKQTGAKLN